MSTEDFLQRKCGFPEGVTLDMESLAMNGHSFGGSTSIGATCLDPRIKVSLTLDPWMGPVREKDTTEFNVGERPMQWIISEEFYKKDFPEASHV